MEPRYFTIAINTISIVILQPGYMRNKEIANVLSRLQLKSGEAQIGHNLHCCYEALVAATIFPSAELELVEVWLENFRLAATRGNA